MKSPAILRVFKGHQLKEVKQFDLEQIVIGHQADVQLDLDDPEVSPIHCMIELREDGYYVCDLGSEYGTIKNGQRILDEKIESNDELQLGQYKIVFFSGIPKPKTAGVSSGASIPTTSEKPSAAPTPKIPEFKLNQGSVPQGSNSASKPAPSQNGVESVAPPQVAAQNSKPQIKETKSKSHPKSKQTYAPPSQVGELKTYLKPHKGASVEILVCWNERIIQAFHYRRKGKVQVNIDSDMNLALPTGILPNGFKLIELEQGARVFFPSDTKGELVTLDHKFSLGDLQRSGRIQPQGQILSLKLEQNEIVYLELPNSQIQLVIRYVPLAPAVALVPPLMLSSGEFMGVLIALAIVVLLYLAVSTMAPATKPADEEDLTRKAQIVFDNKPPPPPPLPVEQKPPQEEVKKVPPPPPKEEPKKVQVAEKDQAQKKKGQAEVAASARNQRAGRAAELAPNPNVKNNNKKFGSVKQGGAVKIGAKEGANANSQMKDVTKVGLFSAFGGGGIRKQLDQAYSGAGGVLGTAANATGTVGMGENRPGDDVGSKFKESGASGKGIAIQGIQGVGTKGRGSGMSAYGSAEGFGDKTSVAIEPGGAEENFVGTIDRDAVRRVVLAHKNQIESCYTRELNKLDRTKRAELSGKVVLKWDIVERGAAKNVKVASSTLNNKAIEECMRARLATWQFPEPPAGLVGEVTYPFLLKPAN